MIFLFLIKKIQIPRVPYKK